jgi:hypothetical protein
MVDITDEFGKNMLGVDFIQKHQLHYNQDTQQISFLQTPSKALFAVKNFTIPPFAKTICTGQIIPENLQEQKLRGQYLHSKSTTHLWAITSHLQ